MADTDVRLRAVRMLVSVTREGKSLSALLPAAQMELDARESAWLQELVFGVCRNYGCLDGIVSQLLKKPPRSKDTDVKMMLWMALYEIGFMSTPDYAVTNSYVDLTKKIRKNWARGLVNASLRQYLRDKTALTEKALADSPYSLPEWIIQSLRKDWPDQAEDIFKACNERAPLTLRVNAAQGTRQQVHTTLSETGLKIEQCEYAEAGLRLLQSPPVNTLPGFNEGHYSVQDQSAQLAASLVKPVSGERILDACAAPGGKSCHLLELEPGIELHCLDNDDMRLQRIAQNFSRLQLSASLIHGDAATPEQWWDKQAYDAILLDAPCSALGAIRRHPDIRLLRRESDIRPLAQQQSLLLQVLWTLLKPGGRLIYATCSVLKQENEQRIEQFLSETPDAGEVLIDAEWGATRKHGRQILPGQHQADGFYYAQLRKC